MEIPNCQVFDENTNFANYGYPFCDPFSSSTPWIVGLLFTIMIFISASIDLKRLSMINQWLILEPCSTHLNLSVVISGAQCPELRQTTFLGPGAALSGISLQHSPEFLAMFFVLRPRVTWIQHRAEGVFLVMTKNAFLPAFSAWTHIQEFQRSHEGVSEVSERVEHSRASERSERCERTNVASDRVALSKRGCHN